jgi:flagellar M-ring protein FliF
MKALLEGLRALGPLRLGAMAAVAIGILGLLAMLAMRGGGDRMALLYGDLDLRDSGQVADHLSRSHIAYRLAGQGSQILVPIDQVAPARVLLAKEGLPSGGSIGYEIFDRGDGMAATEFQQKINETRAMEGELSRTIRAINGVRAARVHLVLPKREPFARERQDAQASVLLTMTGVARLDRGGVQAIVNLIAAAVPGLRAQNISIVDARGDLLARAGEPVGISGAALTTEEIRRATELRLSRSVEEMLERSLGTGHVRAEAAVRMSFDRVAETQERFDPDGSVLRSQQNVSDTSKNTEASPTTSVANNLPNADAANAAAGGSQQARQEETTNFEISKTVRTTTREQPQIDRISLAVMVDGTIVAGADGKPIWQPRGEDELARLVALVKSTIGFDEKRGDQVDVVSMRFVQEDAGPGADRAGLLGMPIEKSDLMRLAETGLFGLIGVLVLLLVLRPMVLRITALRPVLPGVDGFAALAVAANAPFLAPGAIGMAAIAGPDGVPLLEDDSLVSIAQVEGQMRASSLRRISKLVEKHPEETLSVMRGWMAAEAG